MSRPSDEERIKLFLQALTRRGGNAGNYAMMKELNLSENEAEYWRIRNKILDRGDITLGRGKGGSVILVSRPTTGQPTSDPIETNEGEASDLSEEYKRERSLYAPCLATLQNHWTSQNRLFAFEAQVTALQGRRDTGGVWTRPDITAISLRTFPYWPGKHFDLWTFEIKPRGQFNVLGLFEALSHARSATHSWALYHVDDAFSYDENPDLDRMISEAQRLGIGFITFSDPADFSTWTTHVDSVRQSPDPSLHDELVRLQLSTEIRETLQHWSR